MASGKQGPLLAAVLSLGAAAGPAGGAEVELEGQLQLGITHLDADDGASGQILGDDKGRSRIGVRVRQPLGGAGVGIAAADVRLRPDTFGAEDDNGRPFQGREAWVGLQGGLGQLRAGRIEGAYKQAGGKYWDMLNATELEQRRAGGLAGGRHANTGFLNSVVEYRTPSMAGFEIVAQLGFDDRSDDTVDRSDGDQLLGVVYRSGPWEWITAVSRDDGSPSGENRNWKSGLRFDSGAASVMYHFEDVRIRDVVNDGVVRDDDGPLVIDAVPLDTDTRHHMVAISQSFGQHMLWLAWGHQDADDSGFDIHNATLAWTRFFSAGLRWYSGVQYQDRSSGYDSGDLLVGTTGLRFDF